MLGYWDDPERTAEAIDAAGWMHTGDLATIDAEGYGNIVGRHQGHGDPRRREHLSARDRGVPLHATRRSQDVQVFGVPDPKYGEELCAWIVLQAGRRALTTEEIRDFCRGQIAHYKIPRYIRFVDEFPMTVTGKLQKFVMREQMIEKLGLKTEKTA